MSLKLVAIDLDATLLRDDKSYDVERFNKLFNTLTDQGVTFVIASGNGVEKIKSYMAEEILDRLYLAGDNGNDIELDGEHIHTNYFSLEVLNKVADIVNSDDDLQMVINTPNGTFSEYIYEKDEDYIAIYYDDITIIDSYSELNEEEKPIKSAILSSKSLEETKQYIDTIENDIEDVTSVTSGGGWLDVYNEEGGKGSAVKWIQEQKDITPDETMAFGDSLNDSSMMEYANYSVAMKNADDEFKEVCQYEIGTNEEQSVLDILETFSETGHLDFMEDYKR